jgi:hypothetical protein
MKEFIMGWGDILGEGLLHAATVLTTSKWMEIKDLSTLRYTIRGDIRSMSGETIEGLVRALDTQIRGYTMMGERGLHDQGIIMKELLIEEAEHLGIL